MRDALGWWKPKMVPIEQMTEVMNVKGAGADTIKIGGWCRIKRGLYKGDVGKIVEREDNKVRMRACACDMIFVPG